MPPFLSAGPAVLDGLFKLLGDYGNQVPRYTGQRCLSERLSVGGCDLCQQACPHAAITIFQSVNIDPGLCTGCGLCVQVCPSGALEYDVTAPMQAVREQRSSESGAKIVCSQSGEAGRTLLCLARVTASTVTAAGAWDTPLTLVHGDCDGCSLGGPGVPASVERVIAEAQELRVVTGRPARVTLRRGDPSLAQEGGGEGVGRRGMFGALARGARTVVAQTIPDSPLPFVDWSEPEDRVPSEWQWRLRALRPAPATGAEVHWPAPVVDDSCIDCPVCDNVCPTGAIEREVQLDGRVTLQLQLAACTGCNACARSCPPQAIHMQGEWPHAAFESPVLLRDSGNILQ